MTLGHLIFFALLTLANNHLKLGIIGRYHNTLDEGTFLFISQPSSSPLSYSIISYNWDTFLCPCYSSSITCNHWDMHVFFYTLHPSNIIYFLHHSYSLTMCFHMEAFSSNNSRNSVKLLSVHPFIVFKLNNLNTANNLVKFLQPIYNFFFIVTT